MGLYDQVMAIADQNRRLAQQSMTRPGEIDRLMSLLPGLLGGGRSAPPAVADVPDYDFHVDPDGPMIPQEGLQPSEVPAPNAAAAIPAMDPGLARASAAQAAVDNSGLPSDFQRILIDAARSGQVQPSDVQDVYGRGGAGGFIQFGDGRVRFLNESRAENEARETSLPVTDPNAVKTLAAAGLTPSGGRMVQRGDVRVEEPLSRVGSEYSPTQIAALESAGLRDYSDPRLQAQRIETDGVTQRALQDLLIRQNMQREKAAADAAQPDIALISQPNGQSLVVDRNALKPGEVIGQARDPRQERTETPKPVKFGNTSIVVTPSIAANLSALGATDGAEILESANELINGADIEDYLGDDDDYVASVYYAAANNPGFRARLAALTGDKALMDRRDRVLGMLSQPNQFAPAASSASRNPIDDL